MAIITTHKEVQFGVGDAVVVHLAIQEGGQSAQAGKTRTQVFEGTVISIKGRGRGKSFTVRRIGSAKVGIERIFPLVSNAIGKVVVKRRGREGVRHAKLYYIREKPKKEIEKIYSRASRRAL